MRTRERHLGEILAALRRIEAKLDELLGRRPKRLLSKRAAARLLGIDRGTTLEELIREGHLRMVLGKIPDTEIDRLLDLDTMPAPRRRALRQRRTLPAVEDVARAIRELKI